jgi:DNA-binding PadR family transcriptional regulator
MSGPAPGTDETLQSLVRELEGIEGTADDTAATARTEAVVAETADALYDGSTLRVDEGLIKESLPELLTSLVELRRGETHGKGVMDDLERFFGADLSPGTVYPELHDLEDEGVLSVHELVQTKEYSIEDTDAAAASLEDAMARHLALGLVFRRALEELEDVGEEPIVDL